MKRIELFTELEMARHYGEFFAYMYNEHNGHMTLSEIASRTKKNWQGVFNPCNVRFILCNDMPYSMLVEFNDIDYELSFNLYPNIVDTIQLNTVRVNNG